MPLARVTEAIEEIRRGRPVVLVDDEDRENEGDIVLAAEKVTPEWVNFMAKHGRGLICLTLTEDRARELDLPLMVRDVYGGGATEIGMLLASFPIGTILGSAIIVSRGGLTRKGPAQLMALTGGALMLWVIAIGFPKRGARWRSPRA